MLTERKGSEKKRKKERRRKKGKEMDGYVSRREENKIVKTACGSPREENIWRKEKLSVVPNMQRCNSN